MPNELGNHEELLKLRERGFSYSIVGGYLVVHDVFYLDAALELQRGHLAAQLHTPTPDTVGAPFNHQMYWSGGAPFYMDGTPILGLGNADANFSVGGIDFVKFYSNKPPEGFSNYFDLVESYVTIISGPAQEKYGVSPYTGADYDLQEDESCFKFRDTFSAKAELTDLNRRLADEKVAIVGLGGTGSYILDFLVKTPVHSIVAYDFDVFEVHNCFRAPGKVTSGEFGRTKVHVFRDRYDNFRHRLSFERMKIGKQDDAKFEGVTFAFVCVDDGPSRAEIIDLLLRIGIPFIDTGMGIENERGSLDGLIRTTVFTDETAHQAVNEVPIDPVNDELGMYRTLVQISELNAMNAAIAMIRFKQIKGFYTNEIDPYQNFISLGSNSWIREVA